MQNKRYKKIGLWVAITLLTGTTFCPWESSLAATSATIPNTQIPQGGQFVGQNQGQITPNDQNHTTTITQNNQNGVIKWSGGFNVGSNSTVEFRGPKDFNTLNYDKSGTMSQIHGKINSYEKGTNNVTGNIYIVNPSGVQISNAAQINVGSLYVSNATLKDNQLNTFNGNNIDTLKDTAKTSNAELMSLGNINATNVTFSGNRVVLDIDRIKNGQNQAKIAVQSGNSDVVLGSTDGTVGTNVTVNGQAVDNAKNQYNYTWIKNVTDLQNINNNLNKNYALNTSIDAIATKDWKDDNTDTYAKGFKPIGTDEHPFTGKFDGLGFSIFGLTINRNEKGDINTGLFGTTTGDIVQAPSKSGESVLLPNGGKVQVPNLTVQIPSGSVIKLPDGTTVKIDKAITVQIPSGGTAEKSDGTKINLPGLIERNSDGKIVPIPSGSTTDLNNGSTVEFGNGTVQLPTGSTVDIGWSYSYPNPDPNPDAPKTAYFGGGKVTIQSGTWTVQLPNGSVQIPSTIQNVNLIGGNVNGYENTGALIGHAVNTVVKNIKNTVNVNGQTAVGGIVGKGEQTNLSDVFNDATIQGNVGVGGIAGKLKEGSVTGTSYNVGSIHGAYYTNLYTGKTADYKGNISQTDMTKSRTSKYVGGIVGDGDTVTIGNESGFPMYNGLNITAGSSVGGIAGRVIGDSTIQNVLNEGVITATDSSGTGDILNYGKADINKNKYGDDTQNTNAGNAGGIVGESGGFGGTITISNAINRNTVQSVDDKDLYKDAAKTQQFDGYYAGNIGGIVGYAKNTNITNSRNENAAISGSQNVGGIVGHLDTFSTITHSINDGGAITATGSVYWDTVAAQTDTEDSPSGINTPQFANVGGIAGYVSKNAKIASSSNTGSVTADKRNNQLVLFGTGGVVGRIDQLGTEVGSEAEVLAGLRQDASTATVYDSYNTGKVTGDRAVGGIAGAIYNGSIANSYNEGNVITIGGANGGTVGGIVGDARGNTTDQKGSVLYNVFNKGLIGDKTLVSGGRHIGGIVGHLAGIIDGAYNIGEIYNNDSLTGGIAGWLPQGSIYNAFNAGTLNVKSNSGVSTSLTTAAGGIIGGLEGWGGDTVTLQNIYNIGTIRAIQANGQDATGVAGIIGGIHYNHGTNQGKKITLDHVYTTGNIYSNGRNADYNGYIVGDDLVVHTNGDPANKFIKWNFNNVFYITPEDTTPFATNNAGIKAVGNSVTNVTGTAHEIAFANRYDRNSWAQGADDFFVGDTNLKDNKGRDNTTVGADWRKYDESLPILNFFRPKGMDDWFNAKTQAEKDALLKNVDEKQIQFGNVFNPFLTFAGTAKPGDTLEVDASKFHLGSRDGLITTHNLTIHNFSYADKENDTPNAYSGTLASYGNLSIDGTGTIKFGSASRVYGDSVQINLAGDTSDLTINGSIQTLGQADEGNIDIIAGKVSIEGNLKAADTADGNFTIPGLNNTANSQYSEVTENQIQDFTTSLPDREDEFRTLPITSNHNGNINVRGTQSVEILAGRNKQGTVSAGGSLNVTADTSAYVDTDFSGVKGNIDINSAQSTLDISNVSDNSFFNKYTENGPYINISGNDSILAFDAWNHTTNQYDLTKNNDVLLALQTAFTQKGIRKDGQADTNRELFHIWVDNADELQDIAKNTDKNFLTFHYALRQDLDLSNVQNYKAIASGAGEEYTGHFNGRGYSIVGLNVDNNQNDTNIGIFGTIGQNGMVKNLVLHDIDIESSGTNNNIGLLAGTNKGTIENVTVWGGTAAGKGRLGGIVGVNSGTLNQVEGNSVINSWSNDADHKDILGGLVGENTGTIANSLANSGLTNSGTNNQQGLAAAMGGIAGINRNKITNVTSEGVTSGIYTVNNPNNTAQPDKTYIADNVGGIIGLNAANSTVDGAYNDATVSGGINVGGIIGQNDGTLQNAVNAMDVTGQNGNLGGLIGTNTGSVTSGRNNGIITGNENVGGLVGVNAQGATLKDLNNDDSANITGNTYVGGIAGANSGTIDAQGSTLQNTGVITGQQYVGGVAGQNTATGIISNTISNIVLNVKDENATGNNAAQYFGGVVGLNEGTIQGGLNTGDIHADAASYVGGIIGQNKGTLESVTNADGTVQGIGNTGNVTGKNYVGGIIGQNSQKIAGTTIQNTGSVTALDGGAGGIIGENSGAVGSDVNDDKVTNHTELVNAGKVNSAAKDTTGNIGTGGIFGVNHGAIQNTTMKNDVGGIVTGTKNVGGLIGYNDANIMGSRDVANTYYKNQLINNGIVVGGTVDDKGKITINEQSQNIGGLIGNHAKGTLTAGYNTGTVQGGTNVGGVVGTNAGTVSQVFSTLADGQSVKGTTNVGGVIGTNTGTLENSYATHAVTGTTNVGNVVGNNSGTILNIYSQNNTGKLIGNKKGTVTNAYSFVDGDDSATKVLTVDEQKKLASYDGFNGTEWKNYDGNTAPMLKVFLTKASFVPATGVDINKPITTYNGKIQSIVVKPLDTPDTQNGKTYQLGVYLHDGTTKADTLLGYIAAGNASDTHSYQDFIQSFAADATNLLNGTEGKNVKDLLTLWSQQIKTDRTDGVTNPNNLGYDIDNIEFDMAKRKVNVSLDDITRTYGDVTIHDGKNYGNAFQINWGADATDEMKGEVTADNITITETGDEAVDGLKAGQSTHDANVKNDGTDDYQWNAKIAFKGGVNTDNYELATPTGSGNSYVEKAQLTVNVGNASTTYGTPFDATKYNYTVAGNMNGDTKDGLKQLLGGTYDNEQAFNEANGKKTGDVGTYTDALKLVDTNELKNYDVTIDNGDITIDKAHLTVNVGNASTEYGTKFDTSKYGYTVAGEKNGDTNDAVKKLVGGNVKNAQEYDGKNGIWTGNAGHYDNAMSLENYDNTLQNYDVTVNNGDVDISKAHLTVNVGNASTEYGTKFDTSKYGYTVTGEKNGDTNDAVKKLVGGNVKNTQEYDGKNGIWTGNAGHYDDAMSLDRYQQNLQNYDVTVNNGDVDISKAHLTVNVGNASTEYGTKFDTSKYGYTVTGEKNGDTNDAVKKLVGGNVKNAQEYDGKNGIWTGNAGHYDDAMSLDRYQQNLQNYDVTVNNGDVDISKAHLTVNVGNASTEYGTAFDTTKYEYIVDGEKNGDTKDALKNLLGGDYKNSQAFNEDNGKKTGDVGTYKDALTLVNTNNLKNYDVTVDNGDVTIDKAHLTVNVGNASTTYGTPFDATKYNYNVAGNTNGDTVDGLKQLLGGTYDNEQAFNEANGKKTGDVGTYKDALTLIDTNELKNYDVTVDNGDVTIEKAHLTVNVGNASTTYGTPFDATKYNYTVAGNMNGDTKDGLKQLLGGTYDNEQAFNEANGKKTGDVGTYTDALKLVDTNNLKNYDVTVDNGDVTIEKAHLTVNVGNASTTYGTAFDATKYNYNVAGNTNGDTVDGLKQLLGNTYQNDQAFDEANGKKTGDVGTYQDALKFQAKELKNYDVTVDNGDVTIDKAHLTVNVGNASTTYGTPFDATKYNYTVAGNMNGDTKDGLKQLLGGTYDNEQAFNEANGKKTGDVGTYTDALKLVDTNELKNYDVTVDNGDVTIEKAHLTVNVGNASTTYGTAFDATKYNYNVAGNTNGDTVDGLKQLLGNTYQNDQAFDEANGKKTGDVGTYQDALKFQAKELKNYDVTVDNGDVTIDKAQLTINVGNVSTEYGTKFDTSKYGYTVTGEKNGDTNDAVKKLVGGNVTNAQEYDGTNGIWTGNAGHYDNAMSLENYDNTLQNYDVTVNNGAVDISKAHLTVNVGNASTEYGTKFDTSKYGYTVTGEKNGDTNAVVKNLVGGNVKNSQEYDGTNGIWTGNAGHYDNAMSLENYDNTLQNYDVTVNNGAVDISKAHLTVNIGNASTEYGTKFDTTKYGYTVIGEKNGDTNAAVKQLIGGTVTNSQEYDGTNGKWTGNAGTHTGAMNLTKYNDELQNYDVTVNNGAVDISKAQLYIHANDAMMNVGIPPKYTGSDINAGLKNGDTISNADYHYGVKDTSMESIIGTHSGVIGLWHRNQFYTFDSIGDLGKDYPFLKNYNVLFTPGTLIVREIPTGQWDWLYKDYPWDKIKNFRERRAELHYVDGGVFIEQ